LLLFAVGTKTQSIEPKERKRAQSGGLVSVESIIVIIIRMASSSTSSSKPATGSSGSKRKHPESPTSSGSSSGSSSFNDLTRDKIDLFFDTETLTDRQRLCWALQTEQRVRLAKLEARDNLHQVSPTLSSSEHLFHVYPELENETKSTGRQRHPLERDRYAFQRKCHPTFAAVRVPDDSLKSIVSLDHSLSSSHEKHPNALSRRQQYIFQKAPVPPNLLFFEILLEAYMGYKLDGGAGAGAGAGCYHSLDPQLPRCAVMGGAVVAALTGWRDEHILELFHGADLELELNKQQEDSSIASYLEAKRTLVTALHDWFLYHDDEVQAYSREIRRVDQSPFSTGDVDIFLQASPCTRRLVDHLIGHGLTQDLRKHVHSYLDACGFGQVDLHRMGKKIYNQLVSLRPKKTIRRYWKGSFTEEEQPCDEFVYALSKNALNSLLTVPENFEEQDQEEGGPLWPRSTQLIMLSEMADLVGGLMDFDISLVACAYDGNGVHVTPRSAYSLVTMTQIVTPFIMEEHRNWQRIIKVCMW
jgi:hypothetical protein